MASIESGTSYEDRSFERLRLDHAQVDSAHFLDCQFTGCSLVEAALSACRFQRCNFVDCDLSLVDISGSQFASVVFEGSKLVGVDWTRAHRSEHTLGKPLKFINCMLNHGTFIGLDLERVKITDSLAHEVDFRETNLSEAVFSGTDLQGSLFLDTDLSAADLRSARNYLINPAINKLNGARFSLPEAISLLYALDIELDDSDQAA
jgi:uncharacterized protein YjbI with pentapeptide repeats